MQQDHQKAVENLPFKLLHGDPVWWSHGGSRFCLLHFPAMERMEQSGLEKRNDCFQCCFCDWSLKWPQENVKYLILYIPWHILEVIKMSLGLFLNILMHDLDRWEHSLLLLKGKVNISKKNIVSRITRMNLLPVEVLNTPPFTLAGWFRLNLKRRQ